MKVFAAKSFLLIVLCQLSGAFLVYAYMPKGKAEQEPPKLFGPSMGDPVALEGEFLGTVEEIRACKGERAEALKREAKLRAALTHMLTTMHREHSRGWLDNPLYTDLTRLAQAALAEPSPVSAK